MYQPSVSSFYEDDKFGNESHCFILKVKITVGKGQRWSCPRQIKTCYSVKSYILLLVVKSSDHGQLGLGDILDEEPYVRFTVNAILHNLISCRGP